MMHYNHKLSRHVDYYCVVVDLVHSFSKWFCTNAHGETWGKMLEMS